MYMPVVCTDEGVKPPVLMTIKITRGFICFMCICRTFSLLCKVSVMLRWSLEETHWLEFCFHSILNQSWCVLLSWCPILPQHWCTHSSGHSLPLQQVRLQELNWQQTTALFSVINFLLVLLPPLVHRKFSQERGKGHKNIMRREESFRFLHNHTFRL